MDAGRISTPARSAGFTLVELLVVIGIIALLIAILMPALQKARVSAVRVQCMSNHRQVVLGVIQYTAEHKGLIPPATSYYRNSSGNDVQFGNWYSMCWLGKNVQNTFSPTSNFANNNSPLTVCVALRTQASWDTMGMGMNECNGSGFNNNGAGGGTLGIKSSRVREPSRTILFVDVRPDSSGYRSFLFKQFYVGDTTASYASAGRVVAYRHGKSTVVSFVDGHAETFSSNFEDWESTQYKQGLHAAYLAGQVKYKAQ